MDNRMQRKDFSSLGFRMLIGAVLITAVQLASQSVIFGNKPEWAGNMNIVLAVTMIPLYVIGYPLAFWIMKKKYAEPSEYASARFMMKQQQK